MDGETKPADCNCSFPKESYRNCSGHYTTCPCHQRWLEKSGLKIKHPTPIQLYTNEAKPNE